jgi:hypothetical protein
MFNEKHDDKHKHKTILIQKWKERKYIESDNIILE